MSRLDVSQVARAAARSRRVQLSLATNALSSLGNFSVSIAIARNESIQTVGLFAVAAATYVLVAGAVRAGFAETVLATEADDAAARSVAREGSTVALLAAVPALAVGLVWGNAYLIVMAAALHGLCCYEYVKALSLARFSPRFATVMEGTWFAVTVPVAMAAIVGHLAPFVAFVVWMAAGSVIGYVAVLLGRYGVLPTVRSRGIPWRVTTPYLVDFVVGTGSSQVAVNVLTATAGTAVAGSLRSATTLYGPVGLVLSSARTLLIKFLSGRRLSASPRRSAVAAALVLTVPMVPVVAVIAFLPGVVGEAVLGSSWQYAQPLLPVLGIEIFFTMLASVAFAGHKTLLVGNQTIAIRSFLAVARVGGVVVGGLLGGALGAAIAMAVVSALGCATWWSAYVRGAGARPGEREG